MSISNVTSASLRGLIALVEKRDRLEAELAQINKQLSSTFAGGAAAPAAPAAKRGRKKGRKVRQVKAAAPAKAAVSKAVAPVAKAKAVKPVKKAKSGKRGALKEAVLAALTAAGPAGVAVKDLSKKLGVKNQNLHVWFSSTGKTVKGLKKTGTGKWALSA